MSVNWSKLTKLQNSPTTEFRVLGEKDGYRIGYLKFSSDSLPLAVRWAPNGLILDGCHPDFNMVNVPEDNINEAFDQLLTDYD